MRIVLTPEALVGRCSMKIPVLNAKPLSAEHSQAHNPLVSAGLKIEACPGSGL